MRYGSVCSGIEAASAAWEPLGWQASFFSEIEPFPRAVLKHHFPTVPLHGDFTTIESNQYEPIDLLVGGTPCQSFSVAGLRGGLADGRGNLALEYLRLAQRTRPRWLVWENVPGVLSSNGGRDFGAILGGMVELGYGVAYRVLDAQYFGVAQRRRRVFVVGYLGDWRRAAAVLFERHSLSGNPAPRREAGQRPAPTISARPTGGGGLGADFNCDGGLIHCANVAPLDASFGRLHGCSHQDANHGHSHLVAFGGNNTAGPINVATACNAKGGTGRGDFESETFIAHTLRGEGFDASEDGSGRGTPLVPVTAPTLTSNGDAHSGYRDEHGLVPVAFQTSGYGASIDSIASTMQASYDRLSNQVYGCVTPAAQVRRLTPRECERLQGFPDDWTAIPWRGKPAAECPDGPRYKALGNSMAVPVMRWIGERIAMVERLGKSQ